jgi:Ca2+-binding RTX toxin-like protein
LQDVQVSEGDANATITAKLSKVVNQDVVVNYHLVGVTASSVTDYVESSGSVTIPAGLLSGQFTVGIRNDASVESAETLQVVIDSVTGANTRAVQTSSTITIIDDDATLATASVRDTLAATAMDEIYSTLAATVDKLLAERMVTVNGQSVSLASVLGSTKAIDLITGAHAGATLALDAQFEAISNAFGALGTGSGSSATDFAGALMAANSAARSFDLSGDAIFQGVYLPAGSGAFTATDNSTTRTAIAGRYAELKALALESIGDVLAIDTKANFSSALIVMLTSGNDNVTLSDGSEIIAGLGGNDTVNAGGGNDKYIGGAGVDRVNGGAGNDYLYGFDGADVLSSGTGNNYIDGGKGNDSVTGGVGNDTLVGGADNDTLSGGGGSDSVLGGTGDDTITVGQNNGQPFTTTVDGGAGTDTLTIISSLTSLANAASLTYSNGVSSLTDANGGVIQFSSIENFYLNSIQYIIKSDDSVGVPSGGVRNLFWSPSEKLLVAVPGAVLSANYLPNNLPGLQSSDTLTIAGSDGGDSLVLDVGRSGNYPYGGGPSFTGSFVINSKGGSDNIQSANLINSDQIDLGSGDDIISIKYSDLASLNVTKLEGGVGIDTLDFTNATVSASQELTLNTGSATGFENLIGTSAAQVLKGDVNANVIQGGGGADTIYGYAGDDYLYAGTKGYGFGGEVDPASGDNTNDVLYGGDGNDHLIGSAGTNVLDGGLGADTLKGGSNSDTFVLRAGDGGNTIAGSDTIADFQNGTDVLGLSGSLTYNDLVITQGNGADTATANTVVRTSSGEYLAVLLNTQATDVNYLDVSVLSTTALNLTGTSGDDVLLGASGSDSISGGGGSDILLGRDGDDTITVGQNNGQPFTTTVDGGAGTDTLTIISSLTSLANAASLTYSNGVSSLTDANGGVIQFSSIENFYLNSIQYIIKSDDSVGVPSGGVRNLFWSPSEKLLVAVPGAVLSANYLPNNLPGLQSSDTLTIAGSDGGDSLVLDVGRSGNYPYGGGPSFTGSFVINSKGGSDNIQSANLINSDQIDLGSGDDIISIKYSDLASLNVTKLEGGVGIDTLDFTNATVSASQELTLNTGSATGFENLIGTSAAQVLKGDVNANVIQGGGGADTIYGYAGDDYLYAGTKGYGFGGEVDPASGDNTNDVLYGGDGNDHLIGSAGTNVLDGGLGADTLKGGSNSDTFVLRAGDGGNTIAGSDTFSDFTVGTDVIRLSDGLTFSSLVISQGTGSHLADTIIQIGSTHEYLAVLVGVTSSTLVGSCFE